jgi:V/A-type H+/Na+-transporting ATPase subunit F
MNTSLLILTRPGDGLGFRLAGARVEEIAPGEEQDRLPALLATPGLGVVAADEEILAAVPGPLLGRSARGGLPVIFPFAPPQRLHEPGHAAAYVGELLRRAIGYHVRLA